MSELIEIAIDSGSMPAHLWLPPAERGPGWVLQKIFGVSDYIQRRAAQLAGLG